jgi:hypothetical protein
MIFRKCFSRSRIRKRRNFKAGDFTYLNAPKNSGPAILTPLMTVTKRTVKFIELLPEPEQPFILEIGKAGSYYTAKLDTNAAICLQMKQFETGEKETP